jgi:capsid portal protein
MNITKEDGYEIVNGSVREKLNYAMPDLIKFYTQINPNITTTNKGVVYFNSSEGVDDNAYPTQLIDLYKEGSATHSALINLKRDLLIGNGLLTDDPNTEAFLKKKNRNGDNMQRVWEKICMDMAIFESYALQVINNKKGGLYELLHQDISKVRAKAEDELDTNLVREWLISNNWAKISNKQYKVYTVLNNAVPIANYNKDNWSIDGGRQLAVMRKYTPSSDVYSIPSYQSVLQYIQLSKELANYHLNKVTGGLFANAIVYLTGNPDDEEKKKFVRDFKNKYQGSNGEKLLFVWGDYATEAALPRVIPFSTNDEKEVFEELNNIIVQHIITAHRATPELAGIQTNNASLGGDVNKLIAARKYYIKTVIEPLRKDMLSMLNDILEDYGYSKVYVENDDLSIEDSSDDKPIVNNIN